MIRLDVKWNFRVPARVYIRRLSDGMTFCQAVFPSPLHDVAYRS